jgi:hypothetical protein
MPVILFALLAVSLWGAGLGLLYRRAHYRRLAAATLGKPEYDIARDLSPAEFSMIVTGRITRGAIAGEILWLAMHGYIGLTRDDRGRVAATRERLSAGGRLSELQTEALKELFYRVLPGSPAPLRDARLTGLLRYQTLKSLQEKGWINPAMPYLRGNSAMPQRYWVILMSALLAGLIVPWAISGSIYVAGAVETVIVILAVIWGYWIIFTGHFRDAAGIALRTSDMYKTDYDKVYGVYEYMKVSGMDTMLPEHGSLTFKGLDPLYPYAVAAGLDRRIVKELQL